MNLYRQSSTFPIPQTETSLFPDQSGACAKPATIHSRLRWKSSESVGIETRWQIGASMNIEIKQVGYEWVALCTDLDPRVPHPSLATGKTLAECIQNLQQWEKDGALLPSDSQKGVSGCRSEATYSLRTLCDYSERTLACWTTCHFPDSCRRVTA